MYNHHPHDCMSLREVANAAYGSPQVSDAELHEFILFRHFFFTVQHNHSFYCMFSVLHICYCNNNTAYCIVTTKMLTDRE